MEHGSIGPRKGMREAIFGVGIVNPWEEHGEQFGGKSKNVGSLADSITKR